MVTPPWVKLRLRPATFNISFIAQHLHGIGIGGLERGIERRQEAEDQRHQADDGEIHRIGLGRKYGEEEERGMPEMLAGQEESGRAEGRERGGREGKNMVSA